VVASQLVAGAAATARPVLAAVPVCYSAKRAAEPEVLVAMLVVVALAAMLELAVAEVYYFAAELVAMAVPLVRACHLEQDG